MPADNRDTSAKDVVASHFAVENLTVFLVRTALQTVLSLGNILCIFPEATASIAAL